MKPAYLTSTCFALLIAMLCFTACQEMTSNGKVVKAAIAYYKKVAHEKAQMHIEKAGITNSQNAEFLLIKGLTAEKLGDKMGGKQAVKMAMESNSYLSNCLMDGLKL